MKSRYGRILFATPEEKGDLLSFIREIHNGIQEAQSKVVTWIDQTVASFSLAILGVLLSIGNSSDAKRSVSDNPILSKIFGSERTIGDVAEIAVYFLTAYLFLKLVSAIVRSLIISSDRRAIEKMLARLDSANPGEVDLADELVALLRTLKPGLGWNVMLWIDRLSILPLVAGLALSLLNAELYFGGVQISPSETGTTSPIPNDNDSSGASVQGD